MIRIFPLAALLFSSCSSIDLPTVEESSARIQRLNSDLAAAERPLQVFEERYLLQRDMRTAIDPRMINRILRAVAGQRSDDLRIGFPATRPLIQEKKSLLGITYTNHLDIDSGLVTLNLRHAAITGLEKNALRMYLDLDGEGRIAVSGRYTGIPGSSSPRIELSLRDTVTFYLKTEANGELVLTPAARNVDLSATFHVNLLGWEIPWNERIPLRLDEIIPPVRLPGMLRGSIKLPVPAKEFKTGRYEFVTIPVEVKKPEVGIEDGKIILDADIEYR